MKEESFPCTLEEWFEQVGKTPDSSFATAVKRLCTEIDELLALSNDDIDAEASYQPYNSSCPEYPKVGTRRLIKEKLDLLHMRNKRRQPLATEGGAGGGVSITSGVAGSSAPAITEAATFASSSAHKAGRITAGQPHLALSMPELSVEVAMVDERPIDAGHGLRLMVFQLSGERSTLGIILVIHNCVPCIFSLTVVLDAERSRREKYDGTVVRPSYRGF